MGHAKAKSQGTQPPTTSARGHPMPRRASPEQSVTLRHHRLACDGSMRPQPVCQIGGGTPPKRNSSNESHVTGQSDPKTWFDQSNRNAPVAFDQGSMDIDPPFYQKQSDSSNEEMNPAQSSAYTFPVSYQSTLRPLMPAHSSSADDYRSVIDDLTVENKRLKEELRRYKQFGPDPLRKDKLFEIKFHGLPHKKKQELEATLRDFASSLEGSTTSSQLRKKSSKHIGRVQGSSLDSKHASSSSSNSRPVDSAYASNSTGPSSLSHHASTSSVGRPALHRARSSADQKGSTYMREIPQGLLPRSVALTDKEKKKVVVRRLEHLFTGRFGGKGRKLQPSVMSLESQPGSSGVIHPPYSGPGSTSVPVPALARDEPREARIQLNESSEKTSSREDISASNYHGENENRDNLGSGSASNEHSGSGSSPHNEDRPEQRATRPLDLDPDRQQNPVENMDYIRHLGAMAPEYLPEAKYKPQDVSMDADGWIHLNLLCSLAQLHILNVTLDYIRSAVSERSAKFQLSRDGRKIRWRGGTHGTKFSSDSSADSSERSPDTAATDASNDEGQRKRQRTNAPTASPASTKLQASTSPSGFHYKPMFVHQQSSSTATSMDETESQASYQMPENSNTNCRSPAFGSGSVSSPRKKRRRDGAVIYYTNAPFCLDLSGDPGNDSPTARMACSGHAQEPLEEVEERPEPRRTESGSELPLMPFATQPDPTAGVGSVAPEYVTYDTSDAEDYGFCWCERPERTQVNPLQATLEPCGLGGVTPEDHFAILVVTRHPILPPHWLRDQVCRHPGATADDIASRVAASTVSLPCSSRTVCHHSAHAHSQVVEQRYKELKPLQLPPPGIFYPPFTETTDSEEGDSVFEDDCEDDGEIPGEITSDSHEASQRAKPHQSDIMRMAEDYDEYDGPLEGTNLKAIPRVTFGLVHRASRAPSRRPNWEFSEGVTGMHPDSSAATAGEASGYSSGREED